MTSSASLVIEERPFSHAYNEELGKSIERILGLLEVQGVNSREQLLDLVRVAMNDVGIEPARMADDLGYNVSSIYRWMQGESAPHRGLWPVITDWIARSLRVRLESLRAGRVAAAPVGISVG